MDNKKPESLLASLDADSVGIDEANRGSPYAARRLLTKCARLLRSDKPLPDELSNWLADRLTAVVTGENKADYEKALQLTNKRARNFRPERETEELVARSVMNSKLGKHKGYKKDGVPSGAYSEVAEQFNISCNTVISHYKKHAERLREEDEINEKLNRENEQKQ